MNTPSLEALEDGTFKLSIHSPGERDLSVRVTSDELDTLVQKAHNDHARGAFAKMPAEKPAAKPAAKKADK